MNFDDNPSSEGFANQDGNTAQELYNDDIFVGYRYYDTFGVDVSYPFGYGGSYTSFAMSTKSVKADKDKVTVQVKVKNTGTVSGKEVAEVYFSAPDGELDKPYQELAATPRQTNWHRASLRSLRSVLIRKKWDLTIPTKQLT